MTKTVRLNYPQWEGGMNPNYIIGNQIMNVIVPKTKLMENVDIPVASINRLNSFKRENGVDAEEILKQQTSIAIQSLLLKSPDKVITIGGDCSTSLAPFNYLSGKYKNKLGIIWLDAHPDISYTTQSHHLHEMVVSTLMHQGAESFEELINHPINKQQVLFTGLITKDLRPMDDKVTKLDMKCLTPSDLENDESQITSWIRSNKFTKIAVHWDLDVLSYEDFRSIYPAEPHTNPNKFPAAVGTMKLKKIFDILNDIEQISDLVGLTIAEHMPWDAINMRMGLKKLNLFKEI